MNHPTKNRAESVITVSTPFQTRGGVLLWNDNHPERSARNTSHYNAQVNMIETPTMTTFEPGTEAEHRPEMSTGNRTFIGLDIAKANGYTSDRWTRDKRKELEEMLLRCNNGENLAKLLKTSDGRRFTQFAFDLITELQLYTSTHLPALKDGRQLLKGGIVKLCLRTDDDPEQKSLEQFQSMLFDRYGKQPDDGTSDPEVYPDLPGSEDVTDLVVSTRVEYQTSDSTPVVAELLDGSQMIAADTRATFASFRNTRRTQLGNLGSQDAAEDLKAYQENYQKTLQAGLQSPTGATEEPQKPAPTKRVSKKKSV